MKKTRLLLLVLVSSIFSMRVPAQNTKLPRLAAAEFTGNAPSDAAVVRDIVESVMIDSTRCTIVSTYEIDRLLARQGIALSSISSQANVAKLQRENIQYIVTGTVNREGAEAAVSLRVLDVSTARFVPNSPRGVVNMTSMTARLNGVSAIASSFLSGMRSSGGPVIAAPQPVITAPQAPRNVRAGTPGHDSVSLTWDSAGSGVSYKVYYGTQNDASRASLFMGIPSGTSINVSGMASGSTYYFWMTAVQNGQESGKSSVVTVHTAAAVIPANMVLVPAGTFAMGSTNGDNDEQPVHQVTIRKPFYMGTYEVTQKEWAEVMGFNPSWFKGDTLPVEQVSWFDAVEYCNKRSEKEGLTQAYSGSRDYITCNFSANGYRLPTEAEWEWAAKGGGKDTTITEYSGSNNAGAVAWYDANSGDRTHEVGTKAPNSLGLYDMSGNVWEWCWDWYGDYSSADQTDPLGAASGSYRVLRGGCWFNNAADLRSANRGCNTPADRSLDLGFRVVRPAVTASPGLRETAKSTGAADTGSIAVRSEIAGVLPADGTSTVINIKSGGSWFNFAAFLRSAARNHDTPTLRDRNVGFRVVRPYSCEE
ncbi:SUMF1/EgtB/PvdO family nonheme iron enzyme [Breznakiellaceae bacterium SP9]